MRAGTLFFLVIALAAALANGNAEEKVSRLVKTTSGDVRGYKNPESGVFEFLGIPYATAPTGDHKFKAPLPAPVWLEPLEAVDTGVVCPQATIAPFIMNKTISENCLQTSVYVPDIVEKNLPVVVYVHGGAFQLGFGDWLQPYELVADHNIIAVTFNYRLGAHGFLCLGTKDVPGNAGMKDQVALLHWVKQNIGQFGGNPDDVTIAGYSAGSASVDLLMLSKSATGLFNRVIPESGPNTAAFAIQSDPLESAKYFARTLNFNDVDDLKALEAFYKKLPLETLLSDPFINRTDSTFVFVPCLERSIQKDAFLVESPVEILRRGNYRQVPLLYGFANMEGLLRIDQFDTWKELMNNKFSDFLPTDLGFANDNEKDKVAKHIKEFYFGKGPIENKDVLAYIDYFSDIIFAYPTLRSVKLQVDGGHDKIYLYEYSFVDENTPVIPHTTDVRGANHCAQTIAVHEGRMVMGPTGNLSEEFKKSSSTIRQIWANFIKTGQPVPAGSPLPRWPPVTLSGGPHMSLGRELELRGTLLARRVAFWDEIYAMHYRPPVPPPSKPLKPPKNEL